MQFGADEIVEKGVHLRHGVGGGGQLLTVAFGSLALFIGMGTLNSRRGLMSKPPDPHAGS